MGCVLALCFAPPALEVASAVNEGHDADNLRLDLVEKSVAEDEDLARVRLVEFRNHAAALTQSCERLGGSECLLKYREGAGRGVLRSELDGLVERHLGPAVPRLLCGELPLTAQLLGDLVVGNSAPLREFLAPQLYLGQDVQVVEHVLERALVGKAVEQGTDDLFGLHNSDSSAAGRRQRSEPAATQPNGVGVQLRPTAAEGRSATQVATPEFYRVSWRPRWPSAAIPC